MNDFGVSCNLSETKAGQWDAVAGLRLIVSLLSILGTISIIVSAIAKRQVSSPKVHPIFVLSIADSLLAVLWVVGGGLWLSGVEHSRAGCFTVSITTVILECITINLTLVYACFAYAHMKKTNIGNILAPFQSAQVCHSTKVVAVYIGAWVLPLALIVVPFGVITGVTGLLQDANKYSCWCAPMFTNVLPIAPTNDPARRHYKQNLDRLVLAYAVIVATHYLVIFVLLLAIYFKILRHIKNMRKEHEDNRNSVNYGATDALIVKGHSKAKQRIVLFLTVFIFSGFCNLVLALIVVAHIAPQISGKLAVQTKEHHVPITILAVVYIQSVTIPLQGFLNAIVYGWTREDFLYVMATTTNRKSFDSSYEASVHSLEADDADLRLQRHQTPDALSETV